MNRRPALMLLIVFSVAVVAASCEQSPNRAYSGHVYFGAGSYLGLFDLADGSSGVVVNVGNANIQQVRPMQGSKVLVVLRVFEKTREVSKIAWIDTRSLQQTALFEGVAVAFLPARETYVYDDGARISASSRDSDFETTNVILDHRLGALSTIHAVSDTGVIFDAGSREEPTILHYDVDTRALTSLDALAAICTLPESIWDADSERLLCRDKTNPNAYLKVNLDGSEVVTLPLPADRPIRLVAALPGQQAALVTETRPNRMGGRADLTVSVLDFENGNLSTLVKDQHLGATVAVVPVR